MDINIDTLGLSKKDVQERITAGLVNTAQSNITKSTKDIFKDNICTLFNLFNVIIAIALIYVGAWTNCFFIVIILVNTAIGIAQELYAKKLVENLSLLATSYAKVIRNHEIVEIPVEEIVLDDVLILDAGQQISADATIIQGNIEVNESMLSGESDSIHKSDEDFLYSGSFVISGTCYAKAIKVGKDSYMNKMASEVKAHHKIKSELRDSMKKVTTITGILIIPLGILLVYQALVMRSSTLEMAVVYSSAALLGMLPKGLLLLTSISLATGTQKLAKKNVLVQELHALETLAHVDVLCLDKTGTLTQGKMKVEQVNYIDDSYRSSLSDLMSSFLYATSDNNATNEALENYFGKCENHCMKSSVAFTSSRKWSSVSFENGESLIIGAPEVLLKDIDSKIRKETSNGNRVIVVATSSREISNDNLGDVHCIASIVISDPIRENAKTTLEYFKNESVAVKIISGDTIYTVSALAKKAGFIDYDKCVDCSEVDDDTLAAMALTHAIFGRVSPEQKRIIVKALQADGKTVAMSGDGVNDLLALKEADCSIAVAAGSDAAKQISQLVLVDSDFASLPLVLSEGRRVVNNITNLAAVFFVKTVYSLLITLLCLIIGMPFPFIPIQITLIDLAIEGYPTFFLSFESNDKKVEGRFLPNVFKRVIPMALSYVIIFILLLVFNNKLEIESTQLQLLQYLLVGSIGMVAVFKACRPFNKLRVFLCTTMFGGFMVAVFLFHNLLGLPLPVGNTVLVYLVSLILMVLIEEVLSFIVARLNK